jgi:hypothetical protein
VRVGVDDLEGPLLVDFDNPARQDRANALDHAAGQVLLDALDGGRRHGAKDLGLELLPVFLVDGPAPLRLQPLAGADFRQRADHGHQFAVSARLEAQHAETGFVVVERDAFDEAGDLLWLRRCDRL